jgi:vancomycin aglycone glucosyltransferase
MRVLLSTCGLRGDVEPMVALAVRLRALGVQVRMCAPPDAAERLAEVDVEVVPVGQSLSAMMHAITGSSRGDGLRLPAEEIAEQFDQVPAAAEGCAAVVATGVLSAAIGVRSVAEKLGIPYFYAAYCPIYLPSPHFPPPLGRGDGEPPADLDLDDNRALWGFYNQVYAQRYGGPLNSRRAAIGLPPVADLIAYGCTDQPWLAADPVLAPLRPGLDVVQTGAWILPDERPLSPELAEFLAAGSPPVYVGFGSTSDTADTAKLAVEAIRAQGRRVVFSRGWAELTLPDAGPDCFAVGEVNFQALFGRVAAVVHHGGGGTTTVAARAGVPQVVLPQMTDQPYFADQVAELGIGVAFEEFGPPPTFGSLSAALATALAPETRARATAVAGSIRTDGTTVAAELLRDAVSRERSALSPGRP